MLKYNGKLIECAFPIDLVVSPVLDSKTGQGARRVWPPEGGHERFNNLQFFWCHRKRHQKPHPNSNLILIKNQPDKKKKTPIACIISGWCLMSI
jgi:hypothetical protein